MRSDKFGSYEDRFCSFSRSIERLFIVIILGLVLFLVTSQILLSNDTFRHWIVVVEKLEGIAS
ncbi:MAG TPA: hypothetical protein VJ824_12525 [Bacillota bacterium]|nr:hypothetical protein [Bacillota bacterium]